MTDIIIEDSGSDLPPFKKIDEGMYLGTLVRIIDIGRQVGGMYDGKPIPDADKLLLTFEIANELLDEKGELPVLLTKEVKKSKHEKSTLHGIAVSLLGGDSKAKEALKGKLPVSSFIGKSAQIQVGRTNESSNDESKKKPKIASVSPLMKGVVVPKPKTELLIFSLSNHTSEELLSLPEWIQKRINERIVDSSVKVATKSGVEDLPF